MRREGVAQQRRLQDGSEEAGSWRKRQIVSRQYKFAYHQAFSDVSTLLRSNGCGVAQTWCFEKVARSPSVSQEITALGRVGTSETPTYDARRVLSLGQVGLGLEQFQSNRR
jgi:hypothetical protein